MANRCTWQERRELLLDRACREMIDLRAVDPGLPVGKSIRRVARQFRNRSLGQGKKLRLSPGTMRRYWAVWKQTRSPEVFGLHYKPRPPVEIAPDMLEKMISEAIDCGLCVSEIYRLYGGQEGLGCCMQTLRRILPRRLCELARARKKVSRIRVLVSADYTKKGGGQWRRRKRASGKTIRFRTE